MTSPSKEILQKTLNALCEKRDFFSFELREINKTIASVEAMLGNEYVAPFPPGAGEISLEKTDIETDLSLPTKPAGKTPSKKVTEAMVRDAVVTISKEPFPPLCGAHKLIDGYFTISQVCEVLGLSSIPNSVRNAIVKFEKKGMLGAKPYKNGNQYRYIAPAETGPGSAAVAPRASGAPSRDFSSAAIPGTGNNRATASDSDVEKMIRAAQQQGFRVERRGSGHCYVGDGNGHSTTISITSKVSHHKTVVKRDLQKIGVKL